MPTAGEEAATQATGVYSQFEMRKPYLELFSADEQKLFKGLVKLCLDDDASNRPTSEILLPQMKRMEKAVLQSSSAHEEDSNVHLAMWRMQKDLENKDSEAVRVSNRKAELAHQSSTADQEVKNLREQIDNVQLRFRLQGRTIPLIESNVYEGAYYSVNDKSPQVVVGEMPAAETRRPWCFKHGKCVCCLFTVCEA